MELSIARYRLKFIHPFGTAHGLRDGTDSVFLRLSSGGVEGYGEATLPPYLPYTQDAVVENIKAAWVKHGLSLDLFELPARLMNDLVPPAKAALEICYNDLIYKSKGILIESVYKDKDQRSPAARCMVTLGHTPIPDIASKLIELPASSVLKVKLGSATDLESIHVIKSLDNRPLFLDANQGWSEVSQAVAAVDAAGKGRVIGLEQPFQKERWDMHTELRRWINVPIYGDESIQDETDLERAPAAFDGVNLKLMKCGGMDTAARMARRAHELGLKVMLGSMSESSLGCAAMAALRGNADLLDLDGPWLISNDPFEGLRMVQGDLNIEGAVGIGVRLRDSHQLQFSPIGA